MNDKHTLRRRLTSLIGALVVLLLAMPQGGWTVPAQAASNTLFLKVVSARTETRTGVTKGAPVSSYQFIINQDNVGDPTQPRSPNCSPNNSSYPANCNWPSIHAIAGSSPIVTQGDQNDLSTAKGLALPPGKYLISVLADGYKLDGQHFTMPFNGSGPLEVGLQPFPLPTATLRARVFEDNAPVNSGPDEPAERGLSGFRATITDIAGEVTTDVFGNPLCTVYETDQSGNVIVDASGTPTNILHMGGVCYSDANGDVVIPNMGPNRYAMAVIPPDGSNWVQTTTLEGNHDWDTWVQEGATGYDTEFAVAGELYPATIFGFVQPKNMSGSASGEIKGSVVGVQVYTPLNGGLPYNGGIWGGLSGSKIDTPIEKPWISLSSLQNGDQAIYVGQGDMNGNFDIKNVPDGDYTLTYWDGPQNYILDLVNVTVTNGQVVDTGALFLTGWFTTIEGTIFLDNNGNGKQDAGEAGVPNITVSLKRRENSVIDRGSTTFITDAHGHYSFDNAYPLTSWLIVEAYNEAFKTTGVTFQASNQPNETTFLGEGVDVGVLPIIGQSGRLDWGVKRYTPTENGGIVGTVSYDTTRNELDPRYAAVETWLPGIAGLTVDLYKTVACTSPTTQSCDAAGKYQLDSDGSYLKGDLINSTPTEQWERPKNCQARDVNGNDVDQLALPPATGGYDCLEGPQMGIQFQSGDFATLDGNYGFTDACFGTGGFDASTQSCADGSNPTPLTRGDYLVKVETPDDAILNRPIYQVTREEDINVFNGDQYTPQVPPSPCAGALHTVDVAGDGADGPNAVVNPTFVDAGGSPYEGQQRPLCDMKLVTVQNGRSIAPSFTFFTQVPIPGRFIGYIVDDLNLSTNPQDLLFGEKAGVPNSPIGIYDYTNRRVTTIQSDPNGLFEVLLPSTNTINCPSPSGVCPNLYRLVGNDPGVPGALNPQYNPQFRTIAATFEVYPGTTEPADLAPTQIGVSIQAPGSQFNGAVSCKLADTAPQIFAVNKPYFSTSGANNTRNLQVTGLGFGATRGTGTIQLDGINLSVQTWNDRSISADIENVSPGPHQLVIKASNGLKTVNGLTIHMTGPSYNPTIREVGPGKQYTKIQAALDASTNGSNNVLIVVYPGGVPDSSNPAYNPQKAYFENLIIQSPVKLQGVGPGGVYSNGQVVEGSVIDGAAFGGDTTLATNWRTKVGGLQWDGNQQVAEGAVVTILTRNGRFGPLFRAAIDGFAIQGGDQQGFPNNINVIGGTPTGLPPAVVTQGGGIYANGYARYLQITNNIMQSNGGSYGGAIRVGNPDLQGVLNHNENMRIANNRIIANGGTNLAGAIGLFAGSDNYEVASNDICGNFSAEYGGGISHYGYSPNGAIHHNRIYFNRSYDEAGGIMIAGELPNNPNLLSQGAGSVSIYNNLIQANLANDDGGGLRFLMAGNFTYNVTNNMIVNNISTHEGAGIALDDAPAVRVVNNTIMKNITTATAATSNGQPAPAGLSTGRNSALLQATLSTGSPIFSNPLLFNNIFWDNRAGRWTGGGVAGIGLAGDTNAINRWDLGAADGSGTLSPTNSMLNVPDGAASSTNRIGVDPLVATTYDTSVAVFPWRTNPGVVGSTIVAVDAPPELMGNYHLTSSSQAIGLGAATKGSVQAPNRDYDDEVRPNGGTFDSGADEYYATSAPPPPTGPVVQTLDTFNQTTSTLSSNWSVSGSTGGVALMSAKAAAAPSPFSVANNQVVVNSSGYALWKRNTFKGNEQAALTFTKVSPTGTSQGLLLMVDGLKSNLLSTNSHYIAVVYDATAGAVLVKTYDPKLGLVTQATFGSVTFAAGDVLEATAKSDGTVIVTKNGAQVGTTNVTVGAQPWPSKYAKKGGKIGFVFNGPSFAAPNDASFDTFSGGDVK